MFAGRSVHPPLTHGSNILVHAHGTGAEMLGKLLLYLESCRGMVMHRGRIGKLFTRHIVGFFDLDCGHVACLVRYGQLGALGDRKVGGSGSYCRGVCWFC